MRLFRAILVGAVPLATLFIGLFVDKYIMPFLPENPTWVVCLLFALSLVVVIGAFFWNKIKSIVFKSKHNWDAWKVIRYLHKWTKLRGCYIREIEEELRQAALDGDITVWAVLGIVGPLRKMPPEKFADFTFDLRHAIGKRNSNVPNPPRFMPKIYQQSHRDNFLHKEIYYDPWFCKREIKRIWPPQWLWSLWYRVRCRSLKHDRSE